MASINVYGIVDKKGELPKFSPDSEIAFILAFSKFIGKKVAVNITDNLKKRSTPQNAYYWGVIVEMLTNHLNENNGEVYTHGEVHELLKHKFCPEKSREVISSISGEVDVIMVKSTTLLSTVEAEAYYEACRIWINDFFGFYVPLPNEFKNN